MYLWGGDSSRVSLIGMSMATSRHAVSVSIRALRKKILVRSVTWLPKQARPDHHKPRCLAIIPIICGFLCDNLKLDSAAIFDEGIDLYLLRTRRKRLLMTLSRRVDWDTGLVVAPSTSSDPLHYLSLLLEPNWSQNNTGGIPVVLIEFEIRWSMIQPP